MATQRIPGPLGLEGTPVPLGRGTLQLCATGAPGPVQGPAVVENKTKKAQNFVETEGQSASGGSQSAADRAAATRLPEDRVIQALPDRTRDFGFAGHTLRLVRRREWNDLQNGQRYHVVPADEARAILDKLAATTVSRAEKAALQEAIPMLPTRAFTAPSKLLLLRVTPQRYSPSASSEPAMTPSQIARSQIARSPVSERHWIEVKLVDEHSKGISGIDYVIITPDNQQHSGVTGEDGIARLEDIPPGQCKVSFPELDKADWR